MIHTDPCGKQKTVFFCFYFDVVKMMMMMKTTSTETRVYQTQCLIECITTIGACVLLSKITFIQNGPCTRRVNTNMSQCIHGVRIDCLIFFKVILYGTVSCLFSVSKISLANFQALSYYIFYIDINGFLDTPVKRHTIHYRLYA